MSIYFENSNENEVCPLCKRPLSKHYKYQNCELAARLVAREKLLFTQEGRNKWHHVVVEKTMEVLEEYWNEKGTHNISKFKKSFIPSVLEFYKEKNYISNKQLEIATNIIQNNTAWYTEEDIARTSKLRRLIEDGQKSLVKDEMKTIEYSYDLLHDKYKMANALRAKGSIF